MLVSIEPSFVYSKGKPVYFGLYQNPLKCCSSNSRLVFCFVHSSALPCLSLLTRAYAMPTSYVICWRATLSWTCAWQLTEAKDYFTYVYFICANALHHKAFINPTEPCIAALFIRGVNRMVRHDSIRYRFSYPAIRYLPIPQKIVPSGSPYIESWYLRLNENARVGRNA